MPEVDVDGYQMPQGGGSKMGNGFFTQGFDSLSATPSIRQLARSVVHAVRHENSPSSVDVQAEIESNYSVGLGDSVRDASATLVDGCSQREDVSVVHGGFEDRGLDVTLLQLEKLLYIEADPPGADLDLDTKLYQKIRTSVTVIIHNAW
ncbi:hypothetical protein EV702DRAFT_1205901 [Suillus placidus]|uniref:Uncharacterized protein n=1 Tax=Suillus placidus TaxID=48579 RepID=A0A9P7CVP7_9AGAM|nr:hypothetical protein EV702DRAFT_1205901 [Suillus placidus]